MVEDDDERERNEQLRRAFADFFLCFFLFFKLELVFRAPALAPFGPLFSLDPGVEDASRRRLSTLER